MIDKRSDAVQAIQQILGRTHTGREVQKRALRAVASWRHNVESEYSKTECSVCGLILKSDNFVSGCPNCGSTDSKSVK